MLGSYDLRVRVPGTPQAQGSAKGFNVNGRVVITSTNSKLKNWRRDAVSAIRDIVPEGTAALLGEVWVDVEFVFARPQAHYDARGQIKTRFVAEPKTTAPDVDKLARAVCDVLSIAGVYRDDKQVTKLEAFKRFVGADESPYVEIHVMGVSQ